VARGHPAGTVHAARLAGAAIPTAGRRWNQPMAIPAPAKLAVRLVLFLLVMGLASAPRPSSSGRVLLVDALPVLAWRTG
jgi:hypothetical protein